MTPKEVIKFMKDQKAVAVDFKFNDFLGIWQHFTVPGRARWMRRSSRKGSGFDGSSIRGWQPIHASDMLVMPDPTTAVMDPFSAEPTLSLICNIVDPITKEDYTRDPRNIARKAEAYLKSTGIGDTAYFGPEPEFFIFDDIRYGRTSTRRVLLPGLCRRPVEHRAAKRSRTWATSRATRKATFRCRRPTASRTSAPRWSARWRRWGCGWRSSTTRWPRRARRRSTCGFCRW